MWPSLGQTAAALVMRGQGGEMGLGGAAASLSGGCKGRGVQGLKGIPSGDVAALGEVVSGLCSSRDGS